MRHGQIERGSGLALRATRGLLEALCRAIEMAVPFAGDLDDHARTVLHLAADRARLFRCVPNNGERNALLRACWLE